MSGPDFDVDELRASVRYEGISPARTGAHSASSSSEEKLSPIDRTSS